MTRADGRNLPRRPVPAAASLTTRPTLSFDSPVTRRDETPRPGQEPRLTPPPKTPAMIHGAVVLAATLGLSGCGDDGGDSSTASTSDGGGTTVGTQTAPMPDPSDTAGTTAGGTTADGTTGGSATTGLPPMPNPSTSTAPMPAPTSGTTFGTTNGTTDGSGTSSSTGDETAGTTGIPPMPAPTSGP